MKTRNLLIILSLLAMMLPYKGNAQLSIDSLTTFQAIAPQDTVTEGTILNFNVEVDYLSATPFSGTIYLVSGVDSSAGITSIDTIGSLNVINLINSSVSIPVFDTANNQNGYRTGGDIIVIWPIAPGLNPTDTFKADIWVDPLPTVLGQEKYLKHDISIYPNPVNNEIYIKSALNKYIENVKIIDLNGKLIYDQLYQHRVNVSNLSKGQYLLEIELENKQRLIYKLIKAD